MRRSLGAALVAAVIGLAAPAHAADVLVVDPTVGTAFPTIQDAVNASTDGDVVLVRAGTYAEEVRIDARALTVVADGAVRVDGHVFVRNLAAGQVVLLVGIEVRPQGTCIPSATWFGAIDAESCVGAVRVQDCDALGADFEGTSPFAHPAATPSGGPGLAARSCVDVALVDSQVGGGEGCIGVVAPSGHGGPGLLFDDVTHASVVRSVARGGDGGLGDDPGDGGAGGRAMGGTTLHIAYSAFFGGDGGCWGGFSGTPGWTVDGGAGLVRHVGSRTWDFEGLFFGGLTPANAGCTPTPAGGQDGAPLDGAGAYRTLDGFPNAVEAPALVREGQAWTVEIVGGVGEEARLFHADGTAFAFRPRREQPRLVAPPPFLAFPGVGTIPANQRLVLGRGPLRLAPGVDAQVLWLQATVGTSAGGYDWSSPRAVVLLDDAF